jgi:hypothetical protein
VSALSERLSREDVAVIARWLAIADQRLAAQRAAEQEERGDDA